MPPPHSHPRPQGSPHTLRLNTASCGRPHSFHHPNHPSGYRMSASLLRLREGKQLAQGHPAGKWQSWTRTPNQLPPKPVTLLRLQNELRWNWNTDVALENPNHSLVSVESLEHPCPHQASFHEVHTVRKGPGCRSQPCVNFHGRFTASDPCIPFMEDI